MCIYKVISLTLVSDTDEPERFHEFEVGYYATAKRAMTTVKDLLTDENPIAEEDFFYTDYHSKSRPWKKYRVEPIAVLE